MINTITDLLSVKEVEDEQRIYGIRSKPRNEEPSLFELLKSNVNEKDLRYQKKA